jgi:hypothetical protein
VSSEFTAGQAARVLDVHPDLIMILTDQCPVLRPQEDGTFGLRQLLGMRIVSALSGLAMVDAEAVAVTGMTGAREGGSRLLSCRWPTGRSVKLAWLSGDDIDWSGLSGPVLLVPVESMWSAIVAKAKTLRSELQRIN